MQPTYPLPLHHSWPLAECGHRFDLGWLGDPDTSMLLTGLMQTELAKRGIGLWACNLDDNSLTWSPAVHDIFDIPRAIQPTRANSTVLYCDHSRAAMERLRRHAIRHRRGFTLDAEILPERGARRWMRLMAAPVCRDGHVVALHGLKQDVTHLYR